MKQEFDGYWFSGIFSDLNEVLEPVNIDYLLRKYISSILLFLVANKVHMLTFKRIKEYSTSM